LQSFLQSKLLIGSKFTDVRGTLTFFNDFDMGKVKRFYRIDHPETTTVRAWQGHRFEQKWFFVIKGSFLVALVKPDDWGLPSGNEAAQTYKLQYNQQQILHVPGGYVNGFKALEPDSAIIVFSDFTTTESENDNFRFDKNYWFDWDLGNI
jgi:dTDP-4-dehydrorhamnose 3,5-epimerase-like enzyme